VTIPPTNEQHDQVETEEFKMPPPECIVIDDDEETPIPNIPSTSSSKQIVVESGDPGPPTIITCTQIPNPNLPDEAVAAVQHKKPKRVIFQFKPFYAHSKTSSLILRGIKISQFFKNAYGS